MVRTGIGSGNLDLLEILLRGPDAWNHWREENPTQVVNLSKADLIGANLIGANLFRANLRGADLSKANLSGANLIGADLGGANLLGANLLGANLSNADLRKANLSSADLSSADLSSADLSSADLRSAYLSGAIISDKTLIDDKWLPISDTVAFSAPKTHYNFDIKVFDPDVNHSEKERLQAAIDKYAQACSYEEITVISEKSGSWFKKIRYRIAKLISQDIHEEATQAGKEFYQKGKANALNRLEKTGVESTKQIAEATAEILKAVENLDDVVLLLGKLIVMKYTNVDGRSKTYVKTISSDLQLKLESTPALLDSPQAIINFLKSQEELPPAIEEQKALPATPEPLK